MSKFDVKDSVKIIAGTFEGKQGIISEVNEAGENSCYFVLDAEGNPMYVSEKNIEKVEAAVSVNQVVYYPRAQKKYLVVEIVNEKEFKAVILNPCNGQPRKGFKPVQMKIDRVVLL